MIKYLIPEDFDNINNETILYISRVNDEVIDECCGKWKFIGINKSNEVILEDLIDNSKWALEWFSRKKGDYGWFPYSKKNYDYKDIEYNIFIYNNLKKKGKWSIDEISRFNSAIKTHPKSNKKISQIVMTRTIPQIAKRKQNLKRQRINNDSNYKSEKKRKVKK